MAKTNALAADRAHRRVCIFKYSRASYVLALFLTADSYAPLVKTDGLSSLGALPHLLRQSSLYCDVCTLKFPDDVSAP